MVMFNNRMKIDTALPLKVQQHGSEQRSCNGNAKSMKIDTARAPQGTLHGAENAVVLSRGSFGLALFAGVLLALVAVGLCAMGLAVAVALFMIL